MNLTVLLQVIAETTPVAIEESVNEQLSLWDMALKGGWLMIPLALMLLLAIYIFVERLIFKIYRINLFKILTDWPICGIIIE